MGRVMPVWHQLHNTSKEEDHPSESRPYKQYCTTLLTLVKAEATLIGSSPWGVGDETVWGHRWTEGEHNRRNTRRREGGWLTIGCWTVKPTVLPFWGRRESNDDCWLFVSSKFVPGATPPPPIRDAAFSIKSHHTQAMEPKWWSDWAFLGTTKNETNVILDLIKPQTDLK